jgi:hypothetical protein
MTAPAVEHLFSLTPHTQNIDVRIRLLQKGFFMKKKKAES